MPLYTECSFVKQQRGSVNSLLLLDMPHLHLHFLLCLLVVLGQSVFVIAAEATSSGKEQKQFTQEIEPLLREKCGQCHSSKVRKGELDLSSLQSLNKGGESGEPVLAETLDESLLWIMIDGGGMPPSDEPQLTAAEKSLLKSWIEQQPLKSLAESSDVDALHQHDVLPILLLRCAACHGASRQDGNFDIRSIESLFRGGDQGPAIVKGKPSESNLIQRIESEACPPPGLLLKFFVKRPPESEVKLLQDWIAQGAPVQEIQPDIATTEHDSLVSDEDRQHWAFRPLSQSGQVDSIDEFVERKLNEVGLTLSPRADRATLIRRLYFDVTGLPPSLAELDRWTSYSSQDWDRRLIDELLESPHYGERWGRYWLDLAGYADSEGGVSADPVRDVAWKYRDYVIKSFNEDKPYDEFLIQQIAGDELVDFQNADTITDEIVNNLTATGFLRLGIDQTGSRTMNFVPERLGVIDDALKVIGSGVLGLTVECARCHSHKYDAIPQRDYYRLKAIFQGAFDEHDWLSFKTRKLDIATPDHRQLAKQVNPAIQQKLKKLNAHELSLVRDRQLEMLKVHAPELSAAERDETIKALKIADNNRTLPQRLLVEKLQRAEAISPDQQPASIQELTLQISETQQSIIVLKRQLIPPTTIRALWDRGRPSPTYILKRGEHDKPGRLVGPGVPSVLTDGRTPFLRENPFPGGTSTTGRRLAFARWLTGPNHPLTARMIVNRIWYHHFDRGLVETLENFGVKGALPTHPELLDWLARELIDHDWSLKHLHRIILQSRTFQQQSLITDERRQRDPDNRYLSRMPLRRLDAEALRDSLAFVSGKLDRTMFGPPDPVNVDQDGEVRIVPLPSGQYRRSIYAQLRRTEIPSMLRAFDYPEMGPNCVARNTSIVSPQSLTLLNSDRVREFAIALANRLIKYSDDASPEQKIRFAYQMALSRTPNETELNVAMKAVNQFQEELVGDENKTWITFCHILLNSAAFIYVD